MFGRDEKVSPIRLTAVQYIVLAIFLILAYGLWRLQVVQSDFYSAAAEKNRTREVPILAPRGRILDREGRTIVDNYPSFTALLLRDSSRDLSADTDLIAQGLHLDAKEVRERIRKFASVPHYQPIYLKDDITPDELAFIESHRNELPELDTIMAHRRLYPRNGFIAHLIGYVGEVSEEMLNQPRWELNNPGDVVGKSGVELQYNQVLMGKNGSRRAVVNSHGKEVGQLEEKPAEPGKQLKLTIDIDLQIAAEQALEGRNGAIVAMDPRTGEILAMASRPTFDPNDFAVRIKRGEWAKLVNDDDHPLLNKAIQAQLAPGSTFKVIMATAGLQENIAQNMKVVCNGGATFYGRYFKCWVVAEHRVHGVVDIHKAIYQSCDVFFYTLAEKLGIERIAKYATMFGLGQKTGIDLPQEVSGVMPSEAWKIRNFKQKWYAGETISVGIGQGAVTTTPIQLARAVGAIASGGVLRRPHVAFPGDLPPNVIPASTVPDEVKIAINPQNWEIITDAMADVVNPGGTAPSAHLQGIDFAGKTGSAQTISNALKAKLGAAGKSKFKDNGWFVGVEPRRSPEIVVCALLEEGEHGYLAARTVAQVIKAYVEKQRRQPSKMAKIADKVEVGAVWNAADPDDADKDTLRGGRFFVDLSKKRVPLATAAPGLE
ncbi:MAG: penicillin-binding protein 2 [Acidobacteria bacterium 13_1_40CM_4_58_4]|nr:MAG: penicillin-binding protein 2 [Acidobacteria bacterium 13_1_40CM_4_58_4]OLE57627.1 MAG: penicillin-binding protein 2 [Chloroflexi bacterium 13_1_20CM_2_59_7]